MPTAKGNAKLRTAKSVLAWSLLIQLPKRPGRFGLEKRDGALGYAPKKLLVQHGK